MRCRWFAPALAAICLALAAQPSRAQVFLDTFDGEGLGLNSLLDNWVVSDGTIDVCGTGFFDFYPGNGNFLDMDGSSSNAGKITTNVAFGPGNYKLTFELGGNARGSADDTIHVSLGAYAESFTLKSGDPLSLYTRVVTVAGPSSLVFNHDGADNMGIILDDVRLDRLRVIPGVPEPSTLAFALAGLPAVWLLRRKLRR